MAVINKRPRKGGGYSWYFRYRDPSGRMKYESFHTKAEAECRLHEVEYRKHQGTYVDRSRGRVTVGEWADEWLESKTNVATKTYERYEGIVRTHIKPRWGTTALTDVTHADAQKWTNKLCKELSASSVTKTHGILRAILKFGVKDDRLVRNVAEGIQLPRIRREECRYLTHEQVAEMARRCGPEYELLVYFLAYTGLRWGEMAALAVRRIDFLRRRIDVRDSVTWASGRLVHGDTKNHQPRKVAVPDFLIEALSRQVAGKGPNDLVFCRPDGSYLRSQTFQRGALNRAAEEMGLAEWTGEVDRAGERIYTQHFHPHEFRHTAASLAIASGADVKVVQQMLGHKSAKLTLDNYGHLFPDQLGTVADAMSAARQAALEATAGTPVETSVHILCTSDPDGAPEGVTSAEVLPLVRKGLDVEHPLRDSNPRCRLERAVS